MDASTRELKVCCLLKEAKIPVLNALAVICAQNQRREMLSERHVVSRNEEFRLFLKEEDEGCALVRSE